MFHLHGLINIDNWNLSRLITERGKYRKPKVRLAVDITSKDNLVLDWYPVTGDFYSDDAGDFLRWSDQWPIGGGRLPDNRIVMIREFDNLNPQWRKSETYGESEQLLVEGVREHLRDVYRFLGTLFDITLETDLYLTYRKEKWSDEKLTEVAVRNVKEVRREAERQAHEDWPRKIFDEGLGISVDAFLEIFRDAEYKYTSAAELLKQKQVKVSRDRV